MAEHKLSKSTSKTLKICNLQSIDGWDKAEADIKRLDFIIHNLKYDNNKKSFTLPLQLDQQCNVGNDSQYPTDDRFVNDDTVFDDGRALEFFGRPWDEDDICSFQYESFSVRSWTDDRFKQEFSNSGDTLRTLDTSDSLLYAKAFLNWYIGIFNYTHRSQLEDMWIGLMCGIKLPASNRRLVYLPNMRPKLKLPEKSTSVVWTTSNHDQSIIEYKQWYDMVREYLDDGTPERVTEKNQDALNYLGFIALILSRAIVLDWNTAAGHIVYNGTSDFRAFWENTAIKDPTPPPHVNSIGSFKKHFTSEECYRLFAAPVLSYELNDCILNTSIRRSILLYTCLSTMAEFSLGIFDLLIHSSREIRAHPVDIIHCMSFFDKRFPLKHIHQTFMEECYTNSTNQTLMDILLNYAHEDSGEHMWPWANLFERHAMSNLSIAKNTKYAGILVAIIVRLDPTHVLWLIPELDSERADITNFIQGCIAYAKYIIVHLKKAGKRPIKRKRKTGKSQKPSYRPAE